MKKVDPNKCLEFKHELIASGAFDKIRSRQHQYRGIVCPFCGDENKHFYIRINLDQPTEPCLYNCFKCNASGILNQQVLDTYGLELKLACFASSSFKKTISSSSVNSTPDYVDITPEDNVDDVANYIENRLGYKPTIDELKMFQYVPNPYQYATEYLKHDFRHRDTFRDRYWFRITNGSISGRYKDDTSNIRWIKYKSSVTDDTYMYTIKKPFSVEGPITVCISEGIFDSIGLYYYNKMNTSIRNAIYISVLSSNYTKGIEYVLDKGIFGNDVRINIYKDSDVHYIKIPSKLYQLFRSINVYQNVNGKDYGMRDIEIEKVIERKNEDDNYKNRRRSL